MFFKLLIGVGLVAQVFSFPTDGLIIAHQNRHIRLPRLAYPNYGFGDEGYGGYEGYPSGGYGGYPGGGYGGYGGSQASSYSVAQSGSAGYGGYPGNFGGATSYASAAAGAGSGGYY